MIKKAERHPSCAGRFHKTLLYVQLNQSDSLNQVPRNIVGQHSTRFGMFLTHNEVHFRWVSTATCATETLKKSRNGKRCVDMKRTFQATNVDTEFQSGCGAYRHQRFIVFHILLGTLPIRYREVSVVNQKPIGFAVYLAILAKLLANAFALLARIGKNQALSIFGMFKNITYTWVGSLGSSISGRIGHRRRDLLCFIVRCLGCGVKEVLHR